LRRSSAGEDGYLLPLESSLAAEGGCPAARLARAWETTMRRRPGALVEEAARADREFLAGVDVP